MATSILQIRVDDKLKDEVSCLFESLGMDIPTAVRIFFKRAVIERGLPFKVSERPTMNESSGLMSALRALNEEALKNGSAGMSEEEIEAEIKTARAERKNVYYAVVDTNVMVSAALAKDRLLSVPYAIFQGVSKHLFTPIVDKNIIDEYYEVMSRSKFGWPASYGRQFVDEILKYAINEPVAPTNMVLPDDDDRIFYDVAFAHRDKNAYIVTGNIKHFPDIPFAIGVRNFLDLINPVSPQMVVNDVAVPYSALMSALRALNELALKKGSVGMSDEEIETEIRAARAKRK